MTLEQQPTVRPACDHHWIGHLKGGEPLGVRICQFCGDPDWDDLRHQVVELRKEYLPDNPDVGWVAFRIDAWPHDPGANGQEYASGHMPAPEAARWLRDIADRCERYWSDPECPWAGDEGHASMTPRDEERERREEAAKLAAYRAEEGRQ